MSSKNVWRRRIPAVVDAIVDTYDRHGGTNHNLSGRPLPDKSVIAGILDDLNEVLYPGYYGPREMTEENIRFHVGERIDRPAGHLARELYRGLNLRCIKTSQGHCSHCRGEADTITGEFLAKIPEVRRLLAKDVRAGFDGDPAATGLDEIIFCIRACRRSRSTGWPTSCTA